MGIQRRIRNMIFFVFLSFLYSCSCEEMEIEVENFSSLYDCENTTHSLRIDLNNNYTIIRNQEDFDRLVTGECHPDIDFKTYDLIIGRQSSGNMNDTIIYSLMQTCPGKELILSIGIYQGFATMPNNVTYHAFIPKLNKLKDLQVIINAE